MQRRITAVILATLAAFLPRWAAAAELSAPFDVATDLFDHSRPATLGLEQAPGAETISVFRGDEVGGRYNHGAVLLPFRGMLYAQWQNSGRDEDAPDTRVLFAVSRDGRTWSDARPLLRRNAGAHSGGGWWTDGNTLVAYIIRWTAPEKGVHGGVTEFISSTNGSTWSTPQPVRDRNNSPIAGVIEQDPHRLPGGRIVCAFHEQPGLVLAPWYTDDPLGVRGWTRGRMPNLPYTGNTSRGIEPSWFQRSDGVIVMIMRDQAGSHRKLASASADRGDTWSTPVLTNMPDSRSKQSAGNLPDGTAFMAGNPTRNKQRHPLALILSSDGFLFDRAYLLRPGGDAVPPLRHPGRFKRLGFSYPKSIVWNGWLYVAYATNKEDIELTRVPLENLE